MRAAVVALAVVALVTLGYGARAAVEARAGAPDPNGVPIVCRGERGPCWQAGDRVRRPLDGGPCIANANSAWQSVGAERGAVHNPVGRHRSRAPADLGLRHERVEDIHPVR